MKRIAVVPTCAAVLLPLFMLLAGCETESSSQASIRITPNTARLGIGESQEFVATGWTDYSWELGDESAGVLSTKTGDTTTYTAVTALASSNTTQVLTCRGGSTATTTTSTSNGTTSAANTLHAEALIVHE